MYSSTVVFKTQLYNTEISHAAYVWEGGGSSNFAVSSDHKAVERGIEGD